MEKKDLRYEFGKNWLNFTENALNDERITSSINSLRNLLKLDNLGGKTFLDIGCGSGLFSLAAYRLGAEKIVSFDYDPDSVKASIFLRKSNNVSEEKWQIYQGSILDEDFLSKIKPADIVYSWGVLHHTGAMWQAIDNSVRYVKPNGILAIAIYNKVDNRLGGSEMWWHIKRAYNRSSMLGRKMIEYLYIMYLIFCKLIVLRDPFKQIRKHGDASGRGMDFFHDVRDWVGGFPYEYATAGEVFNYLHEKHNLDLLSLQTHDGHICNQFTFVKRTSP